MALSNRLARLLIGPMLLLSACVATVRGGPGGGPAGPAPMYATPSAPAISAGTRVAAIWKDGTYYPGTVSAMGPNGYSIAYDDGDKWEAPREGVVPMAKPGEIVVGDHVLGVWKNGKMYAARVTAVSPGGATLAWDDGDTPMFVPDNHIARIGGQKTVATSTPVQPTAKSYPGLQIGTRVAAKWKDGKYWLGEIAGGQGNQYVIHYADGDQLTIGDDQVIPIAAPGTLFVGQHVMAVWKGATMFPGTITAMDGTTATVKWDDGDTPLAVPVDKIAPY